MTAFIVAYVILEALACLSRVVMLSTGAIPRRTPAALALELIFSLAFIGWGIFLIAAGEA